MKKIYKHRFGYVWVTLRGTVGFTVYCKELDSCGKEIRYWYVQRRWENLSAKAKIPIQFNLLPKRLKYLIRAKKVVEHLKYLKYFKYFKKAIPMLEQFYDKSPTEICEMYPNG